MAARKHGGYRGNEFRIRESVLDFKGRNFGYSKPEPRCKSDGERAVVQDLAFEKRRERCEREREREREKPRYSENRAREENRESRKGHRHSSSNGGNSGGIGVRKGRSRGSDIEPGELSSGSGSDGSVVLESQLEVKEVTKWDNGVELPPAKKHKLSPVVWDRENEHEKESTIANSGGVSVSKSPGFDKSSTGSSCLLDQEQHGSNDEEMREPEDEDVVRTWNISGSRWADEEEGEIFSDEDIPKRKKKSSATRRTKVSSPELEDLTSQVSEGIRENNSLHGLRKNDDMDVEKEVSNSTCPYYSDASERENDSYGSAEPFSPPRRSVNMLQGCRSVLEFERLGRVSEGTYGVVFKARDTRNGDIVALKKVKMEKEREGFPLTALREINILLSSHHPSVVDVKEVVMGDHLDQIFMVMEYMEHDLKGYVESMKRRFTSGEVKCLMLQLLEGVKYLHDNWILHRDLKTSNLLLNNQGELKICDFGLSRQYGSPPKPYTPLVVTLWYRAPELLLKAKQYSTAIDMWSVGCIMAELLAKTPLFSGKSEVDQLDKIFKTLGTPTEKMWPSFSKLPGVKVNFVKNQKNLLREKFPSASFTGRDPVLSEAGFDLLSRLLTYNPEERITAAEAVNHEWFYEDPLPISKFDMPTVPSQHARNRQVHRSIGSGVRRCTRVIRQW